VKPVPVDLIPSFIFLSKLIVHQVRAQDSILRLNSLNASYFFFVNLINVAVALLLAKLDRIPPQVHVFFVCVELFD